VRSWTFLGLVFVFFATAVSAWSTMWNSWVDNTPKFQYCMQRPDRDSRSYGRKRVSGRKTYWQNRRCKVGFCRSGSARRMILLIRQRGLQEKKHCNVWQRFFAVPYSFLSPICTESIQCWSSCRGEIVRRIRWGYAQSTYIRSTTVYVPSSELGHTQPIYRQRVCPSPQNRGGGALACG